jgi:hypothetical protein
VGSLYGGNKKTIPNRDGISAIDMKMKLLAQQSIALQQYETLQ